MNRAKTRTKSKQTDISRSFMALNIMSGREITPDYIGYERDKREISMLPDITADEYESYMKRRWNLGASKRKCG